MFCPCGRRSGTWTLPSRRRTNAGSASEAGRLKRKSEIGKKKIIFKIKNLYLTYIGLKKRKLFYLLSLCTCLWQISLKVSFSVWLRFKLTLAIFAVGKIFIVVNGQIMNKKYGRLVTLVSRMEESVVESIWCVFSLTRLSSTYNCRVLLYKVRLRPFSAVRTTWTIECKKTNKEW